MVISSGIPLSAAALPGVSAAPVIKTNTHTDTHNFFLKKWLQNGLNYVLELVYREALCLIYTTAQRGGFVTGICFICAFPA